MKLKIVYVLCEGQTEQGFVEEVLKPYLIKQGIGSVKSILISTDKKKNTSGGMFSFEQAHKHLELLDKMYQDNDYERYIFTTMFDYYALPSSFPGYNESKKIEDRYQRIEYLENEFGKNEGKKRFVPYLQLHEFEALVFCGIEYLAELYPGCKKRIKVLHDTMSKFGNPELINNNPNTAPSKRIIKSIEGDNKKTLYHYNKPSTGKYITKQVGVEVLREKCRHFNDWIEKLLNS